MKIAMVTGVLLIVVILAAIIMLPRDQQAGPVVDQGLSAENEVTLSDKGNNPVQTASSYAAIDKPDEEEGEPDMPDHQNPDQDEVLQRALQSMRESLDADDPRTPEMSRAWEREKPTEQELADPGLYQAYELRQTKRLAAIYAGVSQEIPAIRNKINAAKLSGSQTSEEIREAEEALAKMESLSEMLRLNHPDLTEDTAEIQEALEAHEAGESPSAASP